MNDLPDALPEGSEFDAERETLTVPVGIDDSVPQAVVLGVGAVFEGTVESLDPLSSAVDPDALDVLFDDRRTTSPDSWVSFPYEAHRVTVFSDEIVEIEPLERDDP